MVGSESDDSPLAVVADAADPAVVELFELLGNETRLAILLALWESFDPFDPANGMSFTALRDRVGIPQGAQFGYHLERLVGRLVEKTGSGYALRPTGLELVQSLVAGVGREATLDPVEIDVACWRCGGETVLTYRDTWLYHVCTDCETVIDDQEVDKRFPAGLLFGEPYPAAILSDRTPEEIYAAAVTRLLQQQTLRMNGVCPRCLGVLDSSTWVCESHEPGPAGVCPRCDAKWAVRIRRSCSVCKYWELDSPAGMVMQPDVSAFYRARGLELALGVNEFERARAVMTQLPTHEETVLSTDPVRTRVVVQFEGDELRLTYDEAMNVLEVDERDGVGE